MDTKESFIALQQMQENGTLHMDTDSFALQLVNATKTVGSLGLTPIVSMQSIDDLKITKEELEHHVSNFCRSKQSKTSALEALLKCKSHINKRRFHSKTKRR